MRAAVGAPAADGPLLRFDRVGIAYAAQGRRVRATHAVSLDIRPFERYVLLGPSGCGKSTLLKAAAGFVAPDEGRVLLDGELVRGPGPDRIVVFQEFDQLPPWKTVRANVAFPLRVARGLDRRAADAAADRALARVGLSAFADAFPHQLSGGMKQRVAIARALAMQPRVLLMDEPFAALDALTRRRMQQELLALWTAEPFTLLFVTHSIEEALLVGSRIGVLSPHPGRLRAELDAQAFGPDAQGGEPFQQAVARIQGMLFDEAPA